MSFCERALSKTERGRKPRPFRRAVIVTARQITCHRLCCGFGLGRIGFPVGLAVGTLDEGIRSNFIKKKTNCLTMFYLGYRRIGMVSGYDN